MPSQHSTARDVVLLHGLGRSRRSMRPIEGTLTRHGYRVLNLGYPSRNARIAEHAGTIASAVRAFARGGVLHVVAHSLGGIVLRYAIANAYLDREEIGRVVLLASPNQGSVLADRLNALPVIGAIYRVSTGPSGRELGTGMASVARELPPVTGEVGVIAGDRTVNPIFSWILGGRNDGMVSVAETAVLGMRDHIVVPHSHSFLMRAPDVIRQVMHFLECGRFAKSTSAAASSNGSV